jgi:hypothetical protein
MHQPEDDQARQKEDHQDQEQILSTLFHKNITPLSVFLSVSTDDAVPLRFPAVSTPGKHRFS